MQACENACLRQIGVHSSCRCLYACAQHTTNGDHKRVPKWLIAAIVGVLLFATGLLILHLNPYWQQDPDLRSGFFDRRVYRWNAAGHLVSALGLLCVFVSVAVAALLRLSRQFRTKWRYWAAVTLSVCGVGAWLALTGAWVEYNASYHWDSGRRITAFEIQEFRRNPLWQRIVRCQIESELNGYLRAGSTFESGRALESTDGDVSVLVLKIGPIAVPYGLGSGGDTLHNTKWRRVSPSSQQN